MLDKCQRLLFCEDDMMTVRLMIAVTVTMMVSFGRGCEMAK